MERTNPEFPVVGISPLGGNSVEGTADGFTPISTDEVQAVPLVWDSRAGAYISKLAQIELDDRDTSAAKAVVFNQEEEFKTKAGYQRT